jgi:hypothetical protein
MTQLQRRVAVLLTCWLLSVAVPEGAGSFGAIALRDVRRSICRPYAGCVIFLFFGSLKHHLLVEFLLLLVLFAMGK